MRDAGADLKHNFQSFIKENGNYIQWGVNRFSMNDFQKDQALLESCMKKFSFFLINIPTSKFMCMVEEIKTMVDKLKAQRENILKELEGAMYHSIFPGECQYLGNTIEKQ